jgi:hypothetical protein
MSVGVIIGSKVTQSETSDNGPSLAAHNGRLWLAWIGRDNFQVNIMASVHGNDFDSTNCLTLQKRLEISLRHQDSGHERIGGVPWQTILF